ncbi:MAG: hypothetical protein K2M76_05290 [Muribaculaceae bacterium]|nr:hypothetical protein [Muribaculaceae bacterium]
MTPNKKRSLSRIRNHSLRLFAEQSIGTDLYRRITVDKEIIHPRHQLIVPVVYFTEYNELNVMQYPFPCHLLTEDNWPQMLSNTFAAMTPGCEFVVGALSLRRNLPWHIHRLRNILPELRVAEFS